jgi:hypothetical protein
MAYPVLPDSLLALFTFRQHNMALDTTAQAACVTAILVDLATARLAPDPTGSIALLAIVKNIAAMITAHAEVNPGIVPGTGLTYLNTGTPTSVTGKGTVA